MSSCLLSTGCVSLNNYFHHYYVHNLTRGFAFQDGVYFHSGSKMLYSFLWKIVHVKWNRCNEMSSLNRNLEQWNCFENLPLSVCVCANTYYQNQNHFDFIQIMNCWFYDTRNSLHHHTLHTLYWIVSNPVWIFAHRTFRKCCCVSFFCPRNWITIVSAIVCECVAYIHTPDMPTDGCYYKSFARQCAL